MSYIERNKWHPIADLPPVWQERGVKLDLKVTDGAIFTDAWWDAPRGRWTRKEGDIDFKPTHFMVVEK